MLRAPAPRRCILQPLLAELAAAGVADEAVGVAVGCGVHATTSAAEKARLVGAAVARRLLVYDAQGIESAQAYLGVTAAGVPVHLERRVAGADLVVTVGVVEPHLYAGFSGGVKGVAIGCAGRETIAWTHSPAFISSPGVVVGELSANPFQQALRDIAARTRLAFAVNVTMTEEGRAAAVAAGEPVAVQAALAATRAPPGCAPWTAPATCWWRACTRPRATTSTRHHGPPPTPGLRPTRP